MNQPLYIAPDEEIISVIARLRSLPENSVTLVFPKHSVVTQSIINLKLLAREGEKLQKQLTLVSQNENARSLAEKIGFNTLPYTQEMEKGSLYLQGEDVASKNTTVTEKEMEEPVIVQETPEPTFTRDIGSQTFYKTSPAGAIEPKVMGDIKPEGIHIQTPPPAPVSSGTTLRVRNVTPDRPPGLNSIRTQEQEMSSKSTVSSATFPDSYTPDSSSIPASTQFSATPTSTAISDFYNRKNTAPTVPVQAPENTYQAPAPAAFNSKKDIPKKAPAVMVGSSVSGKLTKVLGGLVVLLVLVTGALGFFLVFPSATVTINPQTITDSYDQSFTVDANTGSEEIPLKKSTSELTVTVPGLASGAPSTPTESGSRAKGTIKITNNYNNEAQTLVATTRFESSTGKIYRIQESVSVPGNGSVEATVIADGSGESYNMNEGTFTIPGFKGSDKYEKFSATVTKAITGGGGAETLSSNTFIKADEETLRARAIEEVKKQFTENTKSTDDTYTFTDGLVVERVSESNMPKVGSVPGDYEYSGTFKVTAFTTSKDQVTKAVMNNIRSEYDGITFVPTEQTLSFADFTLSENSSQASLKVHLETALAAELDENKIKADLAGKSATELENFTEAHPEVKGLTINFNPSWALKRIPKNPSKIELIKE